MNLQRTPFQNRIPTTHISSVQQVSLHKLIRPSKALGYPMTPLLVNHTPIIRTLRDTQTYAGITARETTGVAPPSRDTIHPTQPQHRPTTLYSPITLPRLLPIGDTLANTLSPHKSSQQAHTQNQVSPHGTDLAPTTRQLDTSNTPRCEPNPDPTREHTHERFTRSTPTAILLANGNILTTHANRHTPLNALHSPSIPLALPAQVRLNTVPLATTTTSVHTPTAAPSTTFTAPALGRIPRKHLAQPQAQNTQVCGIPNGTILHTVTHYTDDTLTSPIGQTFTQAGPTGQHPTILHALSTTCHTQARIRTASPARSLRSEDLPGLVSDRGDSEEDDV